MPEPDIEPTSEVPVLPEITVRVLRAFQGEAESALLHGGALDADRLTSHLAFVCEVLADLIEATGHVARHVTVERWDIHPWHEGDQEWEQAWETFAEAAGPPVPERES